MTRYLSFIMVLFLMICFALPDTATAQHEAEARATSEGEHEEHHAESPLSVVWKWGNFLILFGGLGFYLRKPLREFLDSRARAIEEGLASAREAKEAADRKLAEIEARLGRLDQEIKEVKEQALREAEEEKARILEAARADAQKILELARREIEGLKRVARSELKGYVAELAVKLAEERLKGSIGAEENKKIVLQFLRELHPAKN